MILKKRFIIIPAIIIGMILAIVGISFNIENSKPKYILTKAEKNSITETVEASGTINPVNTVSIGSQVSGLIKEIYVDYNSKVSKGQLLAQIDTSIFQAQVDEARAKLNTAKADYLKSKSTLIYDKANYNRYKTLYQKKYVAKDEVEFALATYRAQQAEVNAKASAIAQYQATLQTNLTNLRYTKIISPVNGVVVSRDVDVGQTVAASFQTPTLFSVAKDLTKMQIEVSVSEADIGKVKPEQKVEYTLDGYPNDTFIGKVTQVRLASTTTSNVVTYTVVVSVSNENNILKPGMSANVSIITNQKENILCVDNSAMRYSPTEITGGKKFKDQGIWVLRKNKPVRISIKTGLTDSEITEVISKDLREGDDVIIGDIGKSQNQQTTKKSERHGPPGML